MNGQDRAPTITVRPEQPLVDDRLTIRITGLPPERRVTCRAEMRDGFDRRWASEATFVSDAGGQLDLSAHAPISGAYAAADSMGLFWSMALDAPDAGGPPSPRKDLEPLPTTLTVALDGRTVATARFDRLAVAPDVTRVPIRDEGLVATLFVPPSAPAPAVIVVGGSGGGLIETQAALLSSHGFTALALAYFNAEHLPPELRAIPLEYFETAITWLLRQECVSGRKVGVIGTSRGGELALLLGATFPQIGAVVGIVPSGVMNGAIARDPATVNSPAWTYRGESLPFIPRDESLNDRWGAGPIPLTPMYRAALCDADAVTRATIPVERIEGPVLLISGEDDQMWPSPTLAAIAMERLRAHRHPYPDEHVIYPSAGHSMTPPYLPMAAAHALHPVRKKVYAYGGTPAGNRAAGEDSWARMLAFLAMHLRADSVSPFPTGERGREVRAYGGVSCDLG
jgi:dienelactone hydrolase